jgi:hypothetical protein
MLGAPDSDFYLITKCPAMLSAYREGATFIRPRSRQPSANISLRTRSIRTAAANPRANVAGGDFEAWFPDGITWLDGFVANGTQPSFRAMAVNRGLGRYDDIPIPQYRRPIDRSTQFVEDAQMQKHLSASMAMRITAVPHLD